MRAFDSHYSARENISEMEQTLHGTIFSDCHHGGAAEQEDPFYLVPNSSFNTGSLGWPSDLPYLAGPFRQEHGPYLDEQEDLLFERSIPLPHMPAQSQEQSRDVSEHPARLAQPSQMDSGQQRHPRFQIREATFLRQPKGDNEEGEDGDGPKRPQHVSLSKEVGGNFVPSPAPQQDTAAKRVKGE